MQSESALKFDLPAPQEPPEPTALDELTERVADMIYHWDRSDQSLLRVARSVCCAVLGFDLDGPKLGALAEMKAAVRRHIWEWQVAENELPSAAAHWICEYVTRFKRLNEAVYESIGATGQIDATAAHG